ncbi:MAG: TonB-dependent receptor plug domain-containing protein [bacterium]
MMRRTSGLSALSLLLMAALPAVASAQAAVTLSGHVSASSMPIRGASVRVDQLDLGGTTDADGRYAFIIPSARVQGQTVTLTVKYLRFRSQSVSIVLVGGALVQDFELATGDAPSAPGTPTQPRTTEPSSAPASAQTRPATSAVLSGAPAPTSSRTARASSLILLPTVDSTALMDRAGPVDLPTALAGRLRGVEVSSTSTLGGTSTMLVRGAHSIVGLTQPLLVLNGVVMDNSNITNAAQSSGLGGFDYGGGVNDLNLEDIASVSLLSGPAAAMRYGGQAANGVLLVTTKSARGLHGFDVAVSQQYTTESIFRLPSYQNAYGQGLGGKFAFFDGKGGGINDATDQSWGPALDGSPMLQASYVAAGRADVRLWNPAPTNVKDFFVDGSTLATNASVQGANETGQFRGAVSNRKTSGITPQSSITHRSALLTGSSQASSRLSVSGDLMVFVDRGENRTGTGFDQSNFVSDFAHMGRQVDLATLAQHTRDAAGKQVSWNYSGQNNPFLAATENINHDDRTRYATGATVTYALSNWLSATARAGTDHSSDTRNFSVAGDWMGGYPYYLGRGDFSTGGFQSDDISFSKTNAEVILRGAPATTGAVAYVFTGGASFRSDDMNTSVQGADKLSTGTAIVPLTWAGSGNTKALFGGIEAQLHDYASLNVTARSESSTLLSQSSSTTLYPAVLGSVDLAHMDSAGLLNGKVESFVVRAGWSRSGNDASSALLQRIGVTSATSASTLAAASAPELTSGWEVGGNIQMLSRRLGLDVAMYDEQSENLIFPSGSGLLRTGTLSNKGFEAAVSVVPIRIASDAEWSVGLSYAKNTNLVESLSGGTGAIALGASYGGLTVQARTGNSLGSLVGTGFLRDASGQLLLRNGHPLPDSVAGPRVLGESAPSWIGGLSSSVRLGGLEFSVLFDTHHGGKVFSASNRAGATSGVLAETAFRPDTGYLISGTDAATNSANTVHVSAEDYFHSLAPITERWLYDATFVKLREARVSFSVPLHIIDALGAQSLRGSLIGRNLGMWTNAPNIDPETVLSSSTFRGAEMGQLPTTKSVGFQLTLTP